MKHFKYIDIELRTSELTTFPRSIPAWELPVLELVHNGGAVKVVGESLRSAKVLKRHKDGSTSMIEKIPTGATEFERLTKRYRRSQTEDGGVGPAFVDLIYGQFGVGELNLQRAIDAATVEVPDEAPTSPEQPVDDLIGEVSSVGG